MFLYKIFYAFSGRGKLLVLFQQALIGILSAGQKSRGFFLEFFGFQIAGKVFLFPLVVPIDAVNLFAYRYSLSIYVKIIIRPFFLIFAHSRYLQEFEKWIVSKLLEGGERQRGNISKTKRTQARESPMSVSVLYCRFFTTTDSSHAGHKKPTGKKPDFSDSGAVSRPDFSR